MPVSLSKTEHIAFQAVYDGEANAGQQRLVMDMIIKAFCRYDDISFRPENQYETAFAEGKRFVGSQIIKRLSVHSQLHDEEGQLHERHFTKRWRDQARSWFSWGK